MSITNRLGLLLDLATLDPPAFKSEAFARWCCQAIISLLARDTKAGDDAAHLSPGTFLAFTPLIPGMADLPRMGQTFIEPPCQVVARGQPKLVTLDGEEVNVVVVIYESDRIGPLRIVAKGKKLGALVGFTFRQAAVIQALGLSPNSRELGAYLMYEPFQQAWTRPMKPSHTLTLCEGGGVMYRHPRVRVTLWLDRYVKDIYPNWVRNGTGLPDLVAIAAERQPALEHALGPAKRGPAAAKRATGKVASMLPKSVPAAAKRAVGKVASMLPKAVPALAKPALPKPASVLGKSIVVKLPSELGKSVVPNKSRPAIPKPVEVIDLTVETSHMGVRKRKRSLLAGDSKVDLDALDNQRGTVSKRQRCAIPKGNWEDLGRRDRRIYLWHVTTDLFIDGYLMDQFTEAGFSAGDVRRAIPGWFRNMTRHRAAY
ncbi:hypothetical protein LXA43DRAFT_1102463 [Ganoderma leucocontextum]|nr:hypothetical protein LXA43DRAFT_1102463 [Ganoderma leucocontextum]